MSDEYAGTERRNHQRIVFSARDEVIGDVNVPTAVQSQLALKIADISAGGVRFLMPRTDAGDIRSGEIFLLQRIRGNAALAFVQSVAAEVRWVLDHPSFDHLLIGCAFVSPTEAFQRQIEQFVVTEMRCRLGGVPGQ
jgi:c-di-GMP-binding flagellar brake protein YcgR